MIWLQLAGLLALLPLCSFAPGFFFVRKLSWSPMEKLCGSVGLSLILLYAACWAVFCATYHGAGGAAVQRDVFLAIAAVCLGLGAAGWRDIRKLAAAFPLPRVLGAFAFLLAWTLTILATIRNYSGLGWGADWFEHFQRTLFFLEHLPANTPIFGGYILPARPPMMNVLAAFFMAVTGDRFELFQVVFTFLNLLPFLSCCLMLPALGVRKRWPVVPLVALFAVNPLIMENATYAWTKLLPVFFVISAFSFYLAGWRKQDSRRTVAAFVLLAAGLLAHYSAGPYCLILGTHYLVRAVGARRWKELAAVTLSSAALLATWFVWSISVYGWHATTSSNTSVTSAAAYQGSTWGKIAGNIVDSIVPSVLRDPGHVARDFPQGSRVALVRDYVFAFYQTNLIFGMGLVAGPAVLWLLYRRWRRGRSKETRFWRVVVPLCVLIGLASVGERDLWGSAHLTLIPLEMLGLTLLASTPVRKLAGIAIVAGCAIDLGLGVYLQAHIEALENTPDRKIFSAGLLPATGEFAEVSPTYDTPSLSAWLNWEFKHRESLMWDTLRVLRNSAPATPEEQKSLADAARTLESVLASDRRNFGGWFDRNGERIEFLGDDVAGESGSGAIFPEVIFWMLLAGLAGALLQDLRRRRRISPAMAAAPPRGRKSRRKIAARR